MRTAFSWWTDKALDLLGQVVQAAGREWGYMIVGPTLDFVSWGGRVPGPPWSVGDPINRVAGEERPTYDSILADVRAMKETLAASEYESPTPTLTARAWELLDEICRLTHRLCRVYPDGRLEFYGKLVLEPATAQRGGLSIQDIEVQRAFNRGREL